MRTVNINGSDYPVKYGLSAIRIALKLVDGDSLSDLAKIDQLPAASIPAFVHAGLSNAAKITTGAKEVPKLVDIEAELDKSFMLFMEVLEIFSEDVTPKNEVEGGGGKR